MVKAANEKISTPDVAIDQAKDAYLEADNFDTLLEIAGDDLVQANEVFGDGYTMVDQKQLEGIEFIVNGYREVLGDFGPYASVTAILRVPIAVEGVVVSKVRFNDGGTGILEVLERSPRDNEGNFKPVRCRKGLKASTYQNPAPDAKPGDLSTTYYFDTSA